MFKLIRLIIILAVIATAGVMFLPLGSVEFKDPNLTSPLVVPAFSMFEEEATNDSDNFTAYFQTIRSGWAVEEEMKRILKDKYIEYICPNDEVVYYDQKNYITIYTWNVEQGFPFTKYSIDFGRGNQCRMMD